MDVQGEKSVTIGVYRMPSVSNLVAKGRCGPHLIFFFAVGLVLAACGGDDEVTLQLPDNEDTSSESADATDEPDDGDGSSEEADDVDNSDAAEQTTTTPASAADDFVPATVSFDPDSPPDQAAVEDLVFAAVEADFNNLLWCMAQPQDCVLERHIAPAAAETRQTEVRVVIDEMLNDGGVYDAADIDAVYRVEVLADASGEFDFGEDNSVRLLGAVTTCEVFGGPYYIPTDDGTVEEVLNDDQVSYMVEYRVWQGVDGVLKVADRSYDEEGTVGECDAFKE